MTAATKNHKIQSKKQEPKAVLGILLLEAAFFVAVLLGGADCKICRKFRKIVLDLPVKGKVYNQLQRYFGDNAFTII